MKMNWNQLLSLKRFGDNNIRPRKNQDETRLGFEVDYDRIIFSDSFRSLQDKTQVVPLSKTDFVHTRLTHSLEVSVVARSLGRIVGEQVLLRHPELIEAGYKMNDFGAIVATAALAHDIGNPPFGHSGEKAIGEYFKNGNGKKFKEQLSEKQWQDIIDFEGNANGFRILNESKKGSEGGLRLSFATLGAFMKYPKESLPKKPTSHIADKKYGIFQLDIPFFKEIASELGLISTGNKNDISFRRHPLAYLVEAADDICYTIIDFEDGINLGLIEVDLENNKVEAIIDPVEFIFRKSKKKKEKLLKEMNQRVTNVNIGGISKEKLVTAYRESVIKVAYYLLDGEKTTKELRELSGIKNSTSLLQKNYYNWFLRVNRGIYKLTDLGKNLLVLINS
jgi:dGTPase